MNPLVLFVATGIVSTILALATCEHKKSQKPSSHHGKHHHSKKEATQAKSTPSSTGEQIVDIDWVKRYDELLKDHGNQLPSKKQPGDREGISIEGTKDRVSPDVVARKQELEQLARQAKQNKIKQTR